ncbi:Gpi16-domain-containing protein [Atractiella rhizophila]|nr:Gpi16-domain-containing protein [Atractiella rhizophila]
MEGELDATMRWIGEDRFVYPHEYTSMAPVSVKRVREGQGVERGRVGVELTNHGEEEREVVWVEQWPWWIEAFWHTKKIKLLTPDGHERAVKEDDIVPLLPRYVPAQARKRATTIEHPFRLPPFSTLRVTIDFQPAFLRYTEYPPDPHRGLDIPSALVIVLPLQSNVSFLALTQNWSRIDGQRIYSSNSLVVVPTPDFSMPYNVIMMTCTVLMLGWGGVFNVCTRRLRWIVEEVEGEKAVVEQKGEENRKTDQTM